MFALKFLLANNQAKGTDIDGQNKNSKSKRNRNDAGDELDDDEGFAITDQHSAKKYAITSYLKLLTARVLKLEQEMSRHKKVSVIMTNQNGLARAYVPDINNLDQEVLANQTEMPRP